MRGLTAGMPTASLYAERMHQGTIVTARVVSATGLAAISALHAVWASGSPWPAKSSAALAEAVVGQAIEMPSAAPTAVVAAGSAGTALLSAGALGHGPLRRLALRGMGAVMLLRAVLGGDAALAALRLPPSGDKLRRLDRRYYRPFAAALGVALWVASARSTR